MADVLGTQEVSIWNKEESKAVTISTDGSKERLDVCAFTVPHQRIHDQQRFFCNRYASGLANGVSYDLAIVTHATVKAHMVIDARWLATGRVEIYEGATLSNNGTALTVINRDRNSTTVGVNLLYHTPTVTSTGTLIMTSIHGTSTAINMSPFIDNFDNEFILKANTKYLIRMASTSGSNAYSIKWDWYEV